MSVYYHPQRSSWKVMFSQACVKNFVHSGGHAWQGGVHGGGVHGRGHAWQGGACMVGDMAGGVHDRGHAWWGHVWQGACMAGGCVVGEHACP